MDAPAVTKDQVVAHLAKLAQSRFHEVFPEMKQLLGPAATGLMEKWIAKVAPNYALTLMDPCCSEEFVAAVIKDWLLSASTARHYGIFEVATLLAVAMVSAQQPRDGATFIRVDEGNCITPSPVGLRIFCRVLGGYYTGRKQPFATWALILDEIEKSMADPNGPTFSLFITNEVEVSRATMSRKDVLPPAAVLSILRRSSTPEDAEGYIFSFMLVWNLSELVYQPSRYWPLPPTLWDRIKT